MIAAAATPAPITAPAAPTAASIIAGVAGYWKNLKSYEVPVTMSGSVKVSFVSVPFTMTGTEYYRAPDREALHMDNVPNMAKGFENTMANMGTPETWPQRYDITYKDTERHENHTSYVLVGVPKAGGNVKTVTMWINAKTYAIETVEFAYNNGALLHLEMTHKGLSPYHLPTHATIGAHFPQYGGNADITYGTYKVNVPIPDSVFQESH